MRKLAVQAGSFSDPVKRTENAAATQAKIARGNAKGGRLQPDIRSFDFGDRARAGGTRSRVAGPMTFTLRAVRIAAALVTTSWILWTVQALARFELDGLPTANRTFLA